jgi:protocatechuate 3,4-dioxygenase beta subunit
MTDKTTSPRIGRREALALFGGAGAAAFQPGAASPAATDAAAASTCILTPEVTEGPYWIPNHLTRRNITEGRPGLALRLRLTVVDATSCRTIKGADVELWHADGRASTRASAHPPPASASCAATSAPTPTVS